jgi:glyoxylate reductase
MKILCGKQIHPYFQDALKASGHNFDFYTGTAPNNSEIDILVTMLSQTVDGKFLEKFPSLKMVLNYAVGFNNIDLDLCQSKGILVGNTPGVLTEATAHHTLLLMLAASRQLKLSVQNIYDNHWNDWEPMGFLGPDLNGKTLGIYGMGRIGYYFAALCHRAFSMKVIYHNRNESSNASDINARFVSFDDLADKSDFISVHAPLSSENQYIFNEYFFSKMKPEAVFINTSRGGLVEHNDLYQALANKQIFAAGLDVTEPEPVANDYPLLGLDNCIITPHIASATFEARKAMAKCVVDNILEFLNSGNLKYPVF